MPTADVLERSQRCWKIILRCSQKVGKLPVKAAPLAVHRHRSPAARDVASTGEERGEVQCKRSFFLINGAGRASPLNSTGYS